MFLAGLTILCIVSAFVAHKKYEDWRDTPPGQYRRQIRLLHQLAKKQPHLASLVREIEALIYGDLSQIYQQNELLRKHNKTGTGEQGKNTALSTRIKELNILEAETTAQLKAMIHSVLTDGLPAPDPKGALAKLETELEVLREVRLISAPKDDD